VSALRQVAALYALYSLVETQPGPAKVQPYIPAGSLPVLAGLVRRARQQGLPDVPAVVRSLIRRRALAVGALCRPPAATELLLVSAPRCPTYRLSLPNRLFSSSVPVLHQPRRPDMTTLGLHAEPWHEPGRVPQQALASVCNAAQAMNRKESPCRISSEGKKTRYVEMNLKTWARLRRRHAQVDMSARAAAFPLAVEHLRGTQAQLRELRHLQLLADSYAGAQRRVFAAAGPADLPPVRAPNITPACLLSCSCACMRGLRTMRPLMHSAS
jgi:hypothetical protein